MIMSEQRAREIIAAGTPARLYEDKRVLVLTPDGTRTCPLPMMVRVAIDRAMEAIATPVHCLAIVADGEA